MESVYIVNLLGAVEIFRHLEDAIDFVHVIVRSNLHPYVSPEFELQRETAYLENGEVSVPQDLEIIKHFLIEDLEDHYIDISFSGHIFTGTIKQKRIYKGEYR